MSGHVHQWLTETGPGVEYVWAPSTWATLPDAVQPRIGAKHLGVVDLVLGESVVDAELVVPDGLTPTVVGDTIPSPYRK